MAAAYIHGFQILSPRFLLPQEKIAAWLMEAHGERRLVERFGVRPSDIAMRGTEIEGVLEPASPSASLHAGNLLGEGVGMEARMRFFSERCRVRFEEFYPAEVPSPDHLIHVTCTGYLAPSAAQLLVAAKGWATEVTHAYHMGCYAALPGIRLAQALVASSRDSEFRVDVVHTELCSLHFLAGRKTPEQVVVQTLFADGFARYSCSTAPGSRGRSLRLVGIEELILPGTEKAMTWLPGNEAMLMTLSREVPRMFGGALVTFFERLCRSAALPWERVAKTGVFAVHPGGPRVLDSVRDTLGIAEEQIGFSRNVLRQRGNMSSATLPHVWSAIVDSSLPAGTPVVSLAFGPGLTLFGALFELV